MWLLYLLAAAGLSVVLVMSKIAKPIRDFFPPPIGQKGLPTHNLFDTGPEAQNRPAILLGCCLCTGFWTGLFMGVLFFLRSARPLTLSEWQAYSIVMLPDCVAFGFASAVVSYCIFAYLFHVKVP